MQTTKKTLGILVAILCGILFGKIVLVSFGYLSQGFSFVHSRLDSSENANLEQFGNSKDVGSLEQNAQKEEPASKIIQNVKSNIEIIENQKLKSITVTFVGDMMFDRHVRKIADRISYENLFTHMKSRLAKSNLVVGNLEGPITNFNTIYTHGSIPYNYTFTFDPKVADILRDANFGVVSLDNNHIFDYGRDGAKQTEANLNSVGILHFGNPDDRKILYKEIEGIKLAFLSYNQFIRPDLAGLLENIQIADKKSDYVIVYPHWGNEYEFVPTTAQVSLAHQFIDHGADIVIGAHPHVIQSKETYKGKPIYYSLGNFIFDQYFNEDVKCGAVITFELNKNRILNILEEFTYLSNDKVVELKDCFGGF